MSARPSPVAFRRSGLPEIDEIPPNSRLVAHNIRELIDACIHTDCTADELAEAARLIEESTQLLRTRARQSSMLLTRSEGGISVNNAVEGPCNPIAPPLEDMRQVDHELSATVTFAGAAEGPPGLAHGGLVAAVLDHALGRIAAWEVAAAMTASLTVDYRNGTPLRVPLDVAARVTSVEGRKIFVAAEIRHEGKVTAEATATMVIVGGLPSVVRSAAR